MDRQIPDVWNIFSLTSGPDYAAKRAQNQFAMNWNSSHGGAARSQDLLHRWCDRSSPCDRPRTYDKFYHKLPGNYIDPSFSGGHGHKSLCSSDADEPDLTASSEDKRKKKRRRKSERKYSRTITERDVRHLDRHLSMKKTIRKKIMRDLQQAFVQDNQSPEQMQDLNRLNFDPKKKADNDAKLLDLLKNPSNEDTVVIPSGDSDSGHGTDPDHPGSTTVAVANVGHHRASSNVKKYMVSDSSSCGGYDSAESEKDIIVLAAEHIQAVKIEEPKNATTTDQSKPKKKSFWKKLTANLKSSSSSNS